MSIDGQRSGSAQHRVSPVATGLAVFAGALMIVSGIGAVFEGIAAVFNDKVFASTPQYLYAFDLTAWGWIHLFLGVLVGLAGVAVVRGPHSNCDWAAHSHRLLRLGIINRLASRASSHKVAFIAPNRAMATTEQPTASLATVNTIVLHIRRSCNEP